MWSQSEFSTGLTSFHPRNRESLGRGLDLLLRNGGESFSRSLGNGFRQTIATILSKPDMNPDQLLEGHIHSTIGRCKSQMKKRIICAQDSTYYNYSGHGQMEGLKPIQGNILGIVQHNVLAMNDAGLPLGLLYQRSWTRDGAYAFDSEAEKWFEGLSAVNNHLGGSGLETVLVQDREADIQAFFKAPRAEGVELVVRVSQARKLERSDNHEVASLAQTAATLPVLGQHQVEIYRANRPVQLSLTIQAGEVQVWPPKSLSPRLHKTQPMYLVVATEELSPEAQQQDQVAAQWLLLTTLPVTHLAEAIDIVNIYAMRWRIERFHYTLKSGSLQVERLQFDDVHTTINALAYYGIVAWRTMYLMYLARNEPELPPQEQFDPLEMKILQTATKKPITTIFLAVQALGKLVNFVPTKKQPLPGIKIMAEALIKLQSAKSILTHMNLDKETLQD